MTKNRNLINNTHYNFKLRKTPSILIGIYIILGSFLIQTVIEGFHTDASPFGFLTVNYFEGVVFIISLLVFLFSLLALFFGNRRHARKIGIKVWNKNSRKSFWVLILLISFVYTILIYELRIGEEQFIIPTFLMGYGFILLLVNYSKSKEVYYLTMTSFALGFLPLLYPNYGFNSLFIFGVAHFILGLNDKPS